MLLRVGHGGVQTRKNCRTHRHFYVASEDGVQVDSLGGLHVSSTMLIGCTLKWLRGNTELFSVNLCTLTSSRIRLEVRLIRIRTSRTTKAPHGKQRSSRRSAEKRLAIVLSHASR